MEPLLLIEEGETGYNLRVLLTLIYLWPVTAEPTTPTPETTAESTATASTAPEPGFGWTAYAEQINGRFAMVGFIALLLLELFTHQDFFTWLGLR